MVTHGLLQQSVEFLGFLEDWLAEISPSSLGELLEDPSRTAIISVDVINGFCTFGPLSSPRVLSIVGPIANLFVRAWEGGIQHILLIQDTHEPDAVEFGQWPPHCIRGTAEAEPVDAFKRLPFYDQLIQIPKNSIHSGMHTGLVEWIAAHPKVDTFIVVGDCTDLCIYQLAMHLRLEANARQLQRRVILPLEGVETYDRPLSAAQQEGGLPHPGNLMHAIFLYHMALNGVEVVRELR